MVASAIVPVPWDQDIEEALVGAVLVNGSAYQDVATFLKADDFYLLKLQYIWHAFGRLVARNDAIDYITTQQELKVMGQLDTIGGLAYLIHLQNACATSMHAEEYGHFVERMALRRRLASVGDLFKVLSNDGDKATEIVIADAERAFASVRDTRFDHHEESWSDILNRLMDGVEERMDNPDLLMGITTGFRELDDLLAGWQRTDLIILGGRPGMGKTSLLLAFILAALRAGLRVGLISREMGRDQIAQRMAATETGINMQKVRLGTLDVNREWPRFVQAVGQMSQMAFMLDDITGATPATVRAKALKWQREHGLDLLVIDYLQLLLPDSQRRDASENEDLTAISRSMKLLAKELNIPVIAAAQLNRSLESRSDKRPQLSDLRGSGSIEQDADLVAFLYRDVVYNDATEFPNRADVIVAKHRNGPTGVVGLHFDKSCTKFSDARTQTIDLSGLGTFAGGGQPYEDD